MERGLIIAALSGCGQAARGLEHGEQAAKVLAQRARRGRDLHAAIRVARSVPRRHASLKLGVRSIEAAVANWPAVAFSASHHGLWAKVADELRMLRHEFIRYEQVAAVNERNGSMRQHLVENLESSQHPGHLSRRATLIPLPRGH